MERVAVDFWRWLRRERSADPRGDLGQASNAGRRQKRRNPTGARQKRRLAASLLRCPDVSGQGCASLAPFHPPLPPLRASHSSISTVSHEFSRLFFHCCFSVKLRRGSTHLEASDGCQHKDRFSERPVCLEGYRRHRSDDDLVLSHARITAAIRSELSLSIPRFERDLHHPDGSASPQGKAKHATSGWRITDQRRDRARFNELEFRLAKNSKQSSVSKWVWRGWNAPNPLTGQRSNLVLPGLFKPRSSRPAAAGKDQI